jgi:type I restriction enzyme, S subunit
MEFGELPAGWARASVCDVGMVVTGNTPSTQNPSNYGGQIPFVKPPQLNDLPIGATREFLSELGAQSSRVLPPFSILVSCIGNLGKTGLNKASVAFNQQINAIVPSGEISPLFLFYQVQSHDFRSQLEAKATATTISIVNKGNFETVKLKIAPLAEQHRIVAKIEELFSELDQGVVSLKTAREQLKVYRQSLLKNAFEGKLTAAWRAAHADQLETVTALQQRIARERQARYQQQLADWQTAGQPGPKPKPPKPLPPLTVEELAELPELPAGWGWIRLGATNVEVFDGPFGSNLKSSDYVADGVRVIRLENIGAMEFIEEKLSFITPEKYQALEKHTVFPGDLVFSSFVTENVRVAMVPPSIEKAVNKADCFCIRLFGETLLNSFALSFLATRSVYKRLEEEIHGVGRPRINTTQLKNVVIPVCSSDEQRELVALIQEKLSEADQLDQTLATALQQADALRQSILKKAFSGQLVEQDKNDEPATALLERIRAEKSNGMNAPRSRRKSG